MAFAEKLTVSEVLAKYPTIDIETINRRRPYYYDEIYKCASEFIKLTDLVTIRKDDDNGVYYVDGLDVTTEYNGRTYIVNFHKAFNAYVADFHNITRKHNNISREAHKISHNLNRVVKGSLKKINAVLAEAEEQYLYAVDAVKKAVGKRENFITKLDAVAPELKLRKCEYQGGIEYRANPYILSYTIHIDSDQYISLKESSNLSFEGKYDQDTLVDKFIEITRKLKSLEK